MNTTIKDRINAIDKRASELEAANEKAKAEAKAKNVKYESIHAPSVIYKLRRDIDALKLMDYAGLEAKLANEKNEKVKTEMSEMLSRFTDPTIATVIEVKEDDVVTALLLKYKDVRDLASKLEAACEKANLKIDYSANKIVRK